ncbi:hypothetical protein ACFQ7F_43970 [Streptomyces sp. NPDC056486]|uniref:hypothetical protein n=1 Tax=Streptomyces sp. NPDC056486 TaxID=3345835 RepID=UPI0036ACFDAE
MPADALRTDRLRGAADLHVPLFHRLLQPGWHRLGDVAIAAGVGIQDAATVVTGLVAAQMASIRREAS